MTSPQHPEELTEATPAETPAPSVIADDKISLPHPDDSPSSDDEDAITTANVNSNDLAPQPSNVSSIWVATTLSLPHEAALVFIVCMAQFCTQAGFQQVLVLLHVIGRSFGVTEPGRLSWLVAGYSLTVGTFILFSGRLGDAFGYKRMLLIGFVWFAIWSVIVGVSVYENYTLAVFARVLQGIGPAICLPNALAIFGATYPPGHRKAMVFSFFGAVAPIGAVIGAAFASLISLRWWPWAMWMMGMWLIVLAVAGYFIIPDLPRKHQPSSTFLGLVKDLDLPGAVVSITGLVLFNFAWNQSIIAGWDTPEVLVPLILGLVLFGVFMWIEFKYAPMPLLPYDAVTSDVAFVLAAVVCGWAVFGIWSLYIIQIMEQIRGNSPLLTVAWFSPVAIVGCIAAVITGKLLGPLQVRPPIVMTMALAAFTIGVILTATVPSDQIYWGQMFVSFLIMPFGMDMSFPAATLILSNAVKKEHQGIGASLVNTVVNYGIALGVGFAGTVETHVNRGAKTEHDLLLGFRGALYMGIGLAVLGLGVCFMFLIKERQHRNRMQASDSEKGGDQTSDNPRASESAPESEPNPQSSPRSILA